MKNFIVGLPKAAMLISFLIVSLVNSSSGTDQIIKQSASYRALQSGYNHIKTEDFERTQAPIAAQEAILEALGRTYEHPVNEFVERQLSSEYQTCKEALGDIVSWCLVLYGDWFGNKASNTLGYYIYALLVEKLPRWVLICSKDNADYYID